MKKPLFVGLMAWFVLTIVVGFIFLSSIEDDLVLRSKQALNRDGFEGIEISVSGRDLETSGIVQRDVDRKTILTTITGIHGVRTVFDAISVDNLSNKVSGENDHSDYVSENTPNKKISKISDVKNAALDDVEKVVIGSFIKTASPGALVESAENSVDPDSDNINNEDTLTSNDCNREQAESMFPLSIYFDSEKYETDQAVKQALKIVFEVAKHCPQYKFHIVGHTDNRGDSQYNVELSLKRARKLRNLLVDLGVDKTRLTNIGMGSGFPVASNDSLAGRAENRRVEFNIVTAGIS